MTTFSARTVHGAGRGRRDLKCPTINLDLRDVPAQLSEGIYACEAIADNGGKFEQAVMHYGPRPVFRDSVSCEVHLLDSVPRGKPETLAVRVVARIRGIEDFPTPQALREKIEDDIARARVLLTQK